MRKVMSEMKFNCPHYLAQRFWKHCVDNDDTPGAVLRGYMLSEVLKMDPTYEIDRRTIRASDRWSVRTASEGGL